MSEIRNSIIDMVEERFAADEYVIRKYDDNNVSLSDALENLLTKMNCNQYKIDSDFGFESIGYETGYVFIAWIEPDGELQTLSYQWEVF